MPPEIRQPQVDFWCMFGERPHLITGYLVQWFRVHFADSILIEHKKLRSLLWRPGDITGILVEDILRWKPENTEQRPAILCARNEYRPHRLGLNNEMQGHVPNDGSRYFAQNLRGSHTLIGLSSNPPEAELLGCEIMREMVQFGDRIRADLDLQRWEPLSLGKPFKVKEAKTTWGVPVTLAVEMQVQWRLLQHTPFLKTLSLTDLI